MNSTALWHLQSSAWPIIRNLTSPNTSFENMVKNLEARDSICFHDLYKCLSITNLRKHKPRRKQREATEVPHNEPQAKERVSTPSHDLLPNGEDRLQLNELMDIRTKLSNKVVSLEQTKTNQAAKIEKLKKRVKKLEGKKKKITHDLKRLYKGRIAEIDANEDLFLIDVTVQDQGRIKDQDLFWVHDLDSDKVFVDVTTGENVEEDATVAESIEGVTIQKPSKFRTTSPPQPSQLPHAKDKGKGIMVEPEKPLKKKDQIEIDEKVARNLEAEMNEEERIAREKNEANSAIIEE
nr:hypothetical protein [Tanacetum cinerariifolium]